MSLFLGIRTRFHQQNWVNQIRLDYTLRTDGVKYLDVKTHFCIYDVEKLHIIYAIYDVHESNKRDVHNWFKSGSSGCVGEELLLGLIRKLEESNPNPTHSLWSAALHHAFT